MFSIRITLWMVCLVILCNLSVYESRKVSGGGRRTTWSRPSSTSIAKPKPQPTFSHSDITKLSYGHNEPSAARRPASPPKNTHTQTNSHKPSAPPAEHAHNTYQQSAPRPNTNTNPNPNPNPNNPNPNNIGWNVPQNNHPGGTNNIGWNTNQQNTQQRVNTANAPPPYPGAPHPQGPPPPYPGNPSHGQNLGAPPAYPGNPSHGQNLGAPPPYPGNPSHGGPPAYPGYPSHGQNVAPPPAYPGLNTGYHGNTYNQNQGRYPQQPGYGQPGYPQQYPGGYGGGYGGAPGGYGGYGGGGFGGLGGFGGGGFGGGGFGGGGYGGQGGYGNGMFAPKKSGISGTTLVGGALLGLTLYSLARDRNQYHYYYPNSQPVYNGQPGQQGPGQGQGQGNVQGTANMPNGEHSVNGDQGAYTSYIGNLSCMSIYNAREVSLWANNTLQEFYNQYPTQAFPISANGSNQSMNFTIVPGEIIHNETLAVTCCGTDKGPIDVLMITNGKSPDVNCIFETYTMPFRRLTFIPNNNTANTNGTNSPPVAAPLTSTTMNGNTSTTMAGITSTTMAGITSTTMAGITSTSVAATNATTLAAATTQEVAAETITPTTTTTTTTAATTTAATTTAGETAAVQNLTTSSANVTEVPTTMPSVELTTIKN